LNSSRPANQKENRRNTKRVPAVHSRPLAGLIGSCDYSSPLPLLGVAVASLELSLLEPSAPECFLLFLCSPDEPLVSDAVLSLDLLRLLLLPPPDVDSSLPSLEGEVCRRGDDAGVLPDDLVLGDCSADVPRVDRLDGLALAPVVAEEAVAEALAAGEALASGDAVAAGEAVLEAAAVAEGEGDALGEAPVVLAEVL
jgi:hypothetical protein